MLWIFEITTLKYKYINMHYHYKRNIRKNKGGNKKQPLAQSTLLLERIFQGSNKFMQLSLKPKNPNLKEYQRWGSEI